MKIKSILVVGGGSSGWMTAATLQHMFSDDIEVSLIESDKSKTIGGGESTVVDNNPVVNLFQAPSTPRYRREDNNQLVPIGANLHEHQDGTIMTEHSMGPNDNSVVVTAVPSNNGTRTDAGGGGTTQDMSEQMDAPDTQTGGGGGTY